MSKAHEGCRGKPSLPAGNLESSGGARDSMDWEVLGACKVKEGDAPSLVGRGGADPGAGLEGQGAFQQAEGRCDVGDARFQGLAPRAVRRCSER